MKDVDETQRDTATGQDAGERAHAGEGAAHEKRLLLFAFAKAFDESESLNTTGILSPLYFTPTAEARHQLDRCLHEQPLALGAGDAGDLAGLEVKLFTNPGGRGDTLGAGELAALLQRGAARSVVVVDLSAAAEWPRWEFGSVSERHTDAPFGGWWDRRGIDRFRDPHRRPADPDVVFTHTTSALEQSFVEQFVLRLREPVRQVGAAARSLQAWLSEAASNPDLVHFLTDLADQGALAAGAPPAPDGDEADEFDIAGAEYAAKLREVLGGEWPQDAVVDVDVGVQASAAMALWDQALGGLVSPEKFAQAITATPEHVHELIAEQQLVAMQSKDGRWHVPVWQAPLQPDARAALAAALQELVGTGRLSAWAAGAWLVNEHPDLDGVAPRAFVAGVAEEALERLVDVARGDAAAAAR